MDTGQIPYGYSLKNGEYIENEQEIRMVKKMYELYSIGNTTYQKIADLFNSNYKSDKVWTKSKVKRILEDERYLDYNGISSAIEQATFERVKEIRDSRDRTKLKLPDIEAIKEKTICSQCGAVYKRHTKTKRKSTWYCDNGCKSEFRIEDSLVKKQIINIINKTIRETSLLDKQMSSKNRDTNQIQKLKTEIEQKFEQPKIDTNSILKDASKLVQARYNNAKDGIECEMTEFIKSKLKDREELEEIEIELFKKIVKDVMISTKGEVSIRFANDKVIY